MLIYTVTVKASIYTLIKHFCSYNPALVSIEIHHTNSRKAEEKSINERQSDGQSIQSDSNMPLKCVSVLRQ